ncbi:acyltransferase [Dehalogenimonas sp. THU2]|uniref:acyltransferase family protein n=1 Tax=Dehalogenimonas sp. THU2 TaxID=3151121 RepID=UPI0032189DE3
MIQSGLWQPSSSFGHSFPSGSPVFPFYPAMGFLGVVIFFFISGFLITQSYERSNDPLRFLWARILRIDPALIMVVVVTVFIIGPFVTTLSVSEYFSSDATYKYLLNGSLIDFVRHLPGVFEGNDVNIPLWTLQYEFLFYLVVLCVGMLNMIKHKKAVLGTFLVFVVLSFLNIFQDFDNLDSFSYARLIFLFLYFSAGMTAYLYRSHINLSIPIFGCAVILLVGASFIGGLPDYIWVFPMGY